MKVLQIVKTNEGASWAFNQARWLHEHGVDIVTVLPCVKGGMAEKYRESQMDTIEADLSLPISEPWRMPKRVRDIRSLVEDVKPDLIHCHFVTNVMMLRLALRHSSVPRLFQVPGPLHLESWLFRNAEILLSRDNDYWAGSCKKTCDIYRGSGIPDERIFLAYYGGIIVQSEGQYAESQGILHREFDLPEGSILVGMVSYFYKPKKYLFQRQGLKGHEDFIDAIALVRKEHPSVVGVIVGDAWGDAREYVERVKAYAEDRCKEGIVFTGFRTDLKRIYRELDVAVHPSHSENVGGAGESLAAGVPTVSTNVGGFPDVVIDGETGYTVPPKSPRELATAIIRMIENPNDAKAMSESGKQLVAGILDIESTGEAILHVYRSILNRGKK